MRHDPIEPLPSCIRSGADAVAIFARLLPHSGVEEQLVIAFLAENGEVLGVFHQAGDPGSVELPIRRIVANALLHDARGLLMAHNHPSGDPTPSRIDVTATQALAAVMLPLGLKLHDHLVRAGDEWRSLVAMELL